MLRGARPLRAPLQSPLVRVVVGRLLVAARPPRVEVTMSYSREQAFGQAFWRVLTSGRELEHPGIRWSGMIALHALNRLYRLAWS